MKAKLTSITAAIAALSAYAGEYYIPQNGESYTVDEYGILYCGQAGVDPSKTSEVYYRNSAIKGWATGYENVSYGSNVIDRWRTPEKALGSAGLADYGDTDPSSPNYDPDASSVYHVVSLGDGGSITLTFGGPIADGEGLDFAVFENAVNAGFLELAYVSVSTDGVNFITFPNFYVGANPIGPYTNDNYPEYIYNLGSKYMCNWGHGYDLGELQYAYDYAVAHYDAASDSTTANGAFSLEYTKHIIEMFSLVDLGDINYVRIDDITGDGSCVDSAGNPIYDPYPSSESGGFDLNAVGVINYAPAVPEPETFAAALGLFAAAAAAGKRCK